MFANIVLDESNFNLLNAQVIRFKELSFRRENHLSENFIMIPLTDLCIISIVP